MFHVKGKMGKGKVKEKGSQDSRDIVIGAESGGIAKAGAS